MGCSVFINVARQRPLAFQQIRTFLIINDLLYYPSIDVDGLRFTLGIEFPIEEVADVGSIEIIWIDVAEDGQMHAVMVVFVYQVKDAE